MESKVCLILRSDVHQHKVPGALFHIWKNTGLTDRSPGSAMTHHMKNPRLSSALARPCAFTLIELLVVIARFTPGMTLATTSSTMRAPVSDGGSSVRKSR